MPQGRTSPDLLTPLLPADFLPSGLKPTCLSRSAARRQVGLRVMHATTSNRPLICLVGVNAALRNYGRSDHDSRQRENEMRCSRCAHDQHRAYRRQPSPAARPDRNPCGDILECQGSAKRPKTDRPKGGLERGTWSLSGPSRRLDLRVVDHLEAACDQELLQQVRS